MQEDLVDKALNTSNKEEISILSKNNDSEVRQSIACNENTTRNILEELSTDHFEDVRMVVAENDNTPPEILEAL